MVKFIIGLLRTRLAMTSFGSSYRFTLHYYFSYKLLNKGLKMYNKFFLISMLCVSYCFAMNNQEDSSFTKITAQGMKQFAGKIIAYQTTAEYFEPSGSYVFDNDNPIYFGQVSLYPQQWSDDSLAYSLFRISKKEANRSLCALSDSTLSKGFSVRLATQEEIKKIENVIQYKQVKWN
jgi:hypothetical protein